MLGATTTDTAWDTESQAELSLQINVLEGDECTMEQGSKGVL